MSRRREQGFSLVEIMIALTIGAIVIAGIYQAFNTIHKWWIRAGVRSDMRQNARAGLETVTRDLEMAGYQTTNYGDVNKTGIAITLASAHEIEMDQQRVAHTSGTVDWANPVYQPRLVYYHLATDMNSERQNLYRQIRTQPGLSSPDELIAENVSEFSLAYFDGANASVAGLPPADPNGSAAYTAGVAVPPGSPLRAIRRIQVTLTTIPAGATTLAADATGGDAAITVASTRGFPPAGQIVIFPATGNSVVGELSFTYADKDATHFNGCTGAAWTTAAGNFTAGNVVARPMPMGLAPKPLTLTASVMPQNLGTANEAIADTTPPSTPAGLAVIDKCSCIDKLRVKWNANAEPDLAGYILFYGPTGSFTVPLRAIDKNDPRVTLNPKDLFITKNADRTASPNTYCIQIAAYDSSGNHSAKSAPVCGNPAPDVSDFATVPFVSDTTVNPGKPLAPTGMTVTQGANDGELVVSWQPPADGSATVGYRLYRSTAAFANAHIDGSLLIRDEASLTPAATTWTDRDLDCGRYYYAVASVNCDETLVAVYRYDSGNAALSDYAVASEIARKTTPPPAPGFTCSPSLQEADVTLVNPLTAVSPDFERTEIFWSKAPAAAPHLDGSVIGDGTHLPDSDSGSPGSFKNRGSQVVVFDSEIAAAPTAPSLEAGATYNLLAVSFDRCGNVSPAVAAACVIPPPPTCPDDPPGPPPDSFTNGTISSCQHESAILGWDYPGKDTVLDLAGFRIARSDLTNELTDGPTMQTTWTDAGPLVAGAAYSYTITATDCVWEQHLLGYPLPTGYALPLNALTIGPVYPGGVQRYVQSVSAAVGHTSAAVTSGAATIPIAASGISGTFANAGQVTLGCQRVSYTGVSFSGTTPVALTGCTWPTTSSGYVAPADTPFYQYDLTAYSAPENFVASDSDASQPYRYHNNVKFSLQNTSRSRVTIKKMAVTWDNPNVVLSRVTVGGSPSGTTTQIVSTGGVASGVPFSVGAEIADLAGGIANPSGAVPISLRFTTPDGTVNRLTDMRNETLNLSLWVWNHSFQDVECAAPTAITIDVPRGPVLGGFSQSAPGTYGIDSFEVVGPSGTARDTDISVPYGIDVNVYGTVFDNSREIALDGCNMGFGSGYPKVVGIGAAPADPAATPVMPTTGTFFQRALQNIGGDRYAIYRTSPTVSGALMPQVSDEVVWYYALAVDNTGNWDRVPNPDSGNYAYFQPPFNVCTVRPQPPALTLSTSTATQATLTWTAPTTYDNCLPIVAGDPLTYDVYIKSVGGDPWPSVPAATNISGTSFSHNADLLAATYYYMVRARNSCASGALPSVDSNVVMECEGASSLDCSLFGVPAAARYGDPIVLTVSDFCAYHGNGVTDSIVFRVQGDATTNFAVPETGDGGGFVKTITAVWSGGGGDQVLAASGSLSVDLVVGGATPCAARTVTLSGGPCPTTPKPPVMGSATRTSTSTNLFTLTFAAPTQNTDNTPLLDLAGYRLLFSTNNTAPTTYTSSNSLDLGLITSPWTGRVGTSNQYYFWLQAYDSCGTRKYSLNSNRVRANQ